jgi:hypothetical protein
MSIRGGVILPVWKGEMDPVWTLEDIVRARTLDARFIALGVPHVDRAKLVPAAVWKQKFSGLMYAPDIETKLKSLLFE